MTYRTQKENALLRPPVRFFDGQGKLIGEYRWEDLSGLGSGDELGLMDAFAVEVRITRPDGDEPDNDKVIAKGPFGMTPGGLDSIDVHFVGYDHGNY